MNIQKLMPCDLPSWSAAWRAGLVAAALLCGALTPAAQAGEVAEVAVVKPDGTIQVFENRLKPKFEDGVDVDRSSVRLVGGVWHLVRKGRPDASCREEALPLFRGSVMLTKTTRLDIGDLLSVRSLSWLSLFDCKDVTCSDNVTGVGNPPQAVRARCENPPSWSQPCSCRFPDNAGGEVVTVIGACKREFEVVLIPTLNTWIRPPFLYYD